MNWDEFIKNNDDHIAQLEAEWLDLLRQLDLTPKQLFDLAISIQMKYQIAMVIRAKLRQREADQDLDDFLKDIHK